MHAPCLCGDIDDSPGDFWKVQPAESTTLETAQWQWPVQGPWKRDEGNSDLTLLAFTLSPPPTKWLLNIDAPRPPPALRGASQTLRNCPRGSVA